MSSYDVKAHWQSPGLFQLNIDHQWQARRTGVFGASGSGKSSVIEVLLGIKQADTAFVAIDDKVICSQQNGEQHALPIEDRPFGWVPQDSQLLPHINVKKNLEYFHSVKDRSATTKLFDELTETLDLKDLFYRFPQTLSGGEKQRVALARAVLAGKKNLLLDEPLAAVDAPRRAQLVAYIRNITETYDLSLIYVSHDWQEILALCDYALILENGRLVSAGTPGKLDPLR